MSEDLQRTDQWHADRCGKFTASRFVDVLARDKKTGKEKLKAWHDCVWQVVTERITGVQDEGVDSYSMRWGREVESFARSAYELETGRLVTESKFINQPTIEFVGCSPDGLVSDIGGLEMKSPKDSKIHLDRFVNGMNEAEFMPQVQGCLWVTGRQWWDWVSYDPRMPEHLRLFKVRIERDEDYIKKLEDAVLEAEARVQEVILQLNQKAA
jgi:predicted phage-related endonuclease